jgi:hypothetical protein
MTKYGQQMTGAILITCTTKLPTDHMEQSESNQVQSRSTCLIWLLPAVVFDLLRMDPRRQSTHFTKCDWGFVARFPLLNSVSVEIG